jgi:hypothetical protein
MMKRFPLRHAMLSRPPEPSPTLRISSISNRRIWSRHRVRMRIHHWSLWRLLLHLRRFSPSPLLSSRSRSGSRSFLLLIPATQQFQATKHQQSQNQSTANSAASNSANFCFPVKTAAMCCARSCGRCGCGGGSGCCSDVACACRAAG